MQDPLPQANPDNLNNLYQLILRAVREARWAWLIGLILMAVTRFIDAVLKYKIPKKAKPYVAIGLGIATNIAMSLAYGMHWLEAIGNGITIGMTAAGGWSALGRWVMKSKAVS